MPFIRTLEAHFYPDKLRVTYYVSCRIGLEPFGPVSPKWIPVRFRSGHRTSGDREMSATGSFEFLSRLPPSGRTGYAAPKPGWRVRGGCRDAADRGGPLARWRISDYFNRNWYRSEETPMITRALILFALALSGIGAAHAFSQTLGARPPGADTGRASRHRGLRSGQ